MGRMNQRDKSALAGTAAALLRAGQRARELARQAHTPLVVYRNGKVEHLEVADAPKPADGKR